MHSESLHNYCQQIVQELVHEQNWVLSTDGINTLCDAILPFIEDIPGITPTQIRNIAGNYIVDGPTVQQMLTPGSQQGEKFWEDWRGQMLQAAKAKGLSPEDAEDFVQTIFLSVRNALANFKFKSRLHTFFYAVFKRQFAKWLQTKYKRAETTLEENSANVAPELVDTNSVPHVENAEVRELVRQEIEKILKSEDYQILYWYYVEKSFVDTVSNEEKKWTDKVIGKTLNLPLNTVTARRTRAIARLRQNSRLAMLFQDLFESRDLPDQN